MQRLLFLMFFLFIIPGFASAQNIPKKAGSKSSSDKRKFAANTIIFKVNPAIKDQFAREKEKSINLQKIHQEIGIKNIQRLFPTTRAPHAAKNKLGQPLIDLTAVYILNYTSDIPVSKAIEKILKTGMVLYAEPLYEDELLYIPNDPFIDTALAHFASPTLYLKNMKYYEALDITRGDTNVVIGIIDTGVKLDHEDLKNNIKYNYADPINGLDDDGDGYVDNFYGWDVGMLDNDPTAFEGHGVEVSGIAAASTDNGLGIAGIGDSCKFLPIKAASDASSSAIINGYAGIVYAAEHGCKVLNVSWGGVGGYSSTLQDVINYAAINHDVVVVAAAGNSGLNEDFYPASYDNVLSVAALQTKWETSIDSMMEIKADFATYSYYVDIGAQGRRLSSTTIDGSYATGLVGSSFASPLVAGAAGLIRSKYPSLTGLQVAELLRITADPLMDTIPENLPFVQEKLGKGRVNLYRALTDHTLPAIRVYEKHLRNKFGEIASAGDTVELQCKFRNYLQPTVNAKTTLTIVSGNASVTQGNFDIGALNTLDSINNYSASYKIYIDPNAPVDDLIIFRVGFSDPATGYDDYQYFEFNVNPSYVDIDTNQIRLTVTSDGRLGFPDDLYNTGNGLVYKTQELIYESGLMISTGPTKVMDCVRSSPAGTTDFDFTYLSNQKYAKLPEGDQGARTILTDTFTTGSIGLIIDQRSYAFGSSPNDKYVIIEYQIKNVSGNSLDSLYVGLFTDWDIQFYSSNKANWDSQDSIGYTYYTGSGGIYGGVCLLTNNPPACFSMDNGSVGGNNINPNAGFTTAQKYYTLANGIGRPTAGGSSGYDVSQVVGGSLYKIANNETRTIAFAMVVGDNLTDLQKNARSAKNTFRFYNTSPIPSVADQNYCKGDTVNITIAPSNGTRFNFYNHPTDTIPAYTGASYYIPGITRSDTVYVKGADSLFESSSVPAKIIVHTELSADFSYVPQTVDLSVSDVAYFISTSKNAISASWEMGDGTTYKDTSEVMHHYLLAGNYKVTLTTKDSYGCVDTVSHTVKVTGSHSFPFVEDGIMLYPNPAHSQLNIKFILDSPHNISIQIYDSYGQEMEKISSDNVTTNSFPISVDGKKKGMYYAKIDLGDKIVIRKFIIE